MNFAMRWRWAVLAISIFVVAGMGALLLTPHSSAWSGNNWHDSPAPTTRTWSEKDIVGSWKYVSNAGHGSTITITFNSDGTFHQVVGLYGTKTMSQDGFWSIRAGADPRRGFVPGKLNVYGALMEMGTWTPRDWDWWDIVESRKRPGQLAISGGAFPDPDGYQEFEKLP